MSRQSELAELSRVYDSSALSNRNVVINGGMTVAQRSSGTVTVSDGSNEGYATVDRFELRFNATAGGAIEMSQSTDTPDGFANSVKLKCSTADSAHTGTQSIYLGQRIEAQNLQQLGYGSSGAKQITVSWYMKTVNYTDPISLALETKDGTAEYFVKSYTPTTSWARYTCTVPASTSATIANDSGNGMEVKFVIAGTSGGTHAASSDSTAWSTTRADYRNNIGNFVASTSNEIYITGVQLEVGDTATPFEPRSFGQELALCQRYTFVHETGVAYGWSALSGYCNTTSNALSFYQFPVKMRAAPALTVSGDLQILDGFTSYSVTSKSLGLGTVFNARVDVGASGLTAGRHIATRNNNDADCKVIFDAEL